MYPIRPFPEDSLDRPAFAKRFCLPSGSPTRNAGPHNFNFAKSQKTLVSTLQSQRPRLDPSPTPLIDGPGASVECRTSSVDGGGIRPGVSCTQFCADHQNPTECDRLSRYR